MKKLLVTTCALVLAATMAQPASAQIQYGAQLNYSGDLGIGARGQFDLGSMLNLEGALADLKGVVSANYYFLDCDPLDCTYIEINGNGLYPIEMEGALAPYAGGGLNLAYGAAEFQDPISGNTISSSNTDIGLNVLGGANFELAGFSAFAEAKIELGGGEEFILTFGVLFGGGD